MPLFVQLWVAVLVMMNLLVPLLFLEHIEALATIVVFLIGAVTLMVLTGIFGFTRLLGLGHFLWFPLLVWLWMRLGQIPSDDGFGFWIRVLMILNSLSLMIDVIDVVRYFKGERAEVVQGL